MVTAVVLGAALAFVNHRINSEEAAHQAEIDGIRGEYSSAMAVYEKEMSDFKAKQLEFATRTVNSLKLLAALAKLSDPSSELVIATSLSGDELINSMTDLLNLWQENELIVSRKP